MPPGDGLDPIASRSPPPPGGYCVPRCLRLSSWRRAGHASPLAAALPPDHRLQLITHIQTIAIGGNRLPCRRLEDHHWDELLRVLPGPLVVDAVGEHHRLYVGVMPSWYQVLAGPATWLYSPGLKRLSGQIGQYS